MAKTKDLRVQTVVPATPAAGVVSQYVDASGICVQVNEGGTVYSVGQQWSGSLAGIGGSVAAVISVGITGTLTGAAIFLPVTGPSGLKLAIPAWKYV